MHRVPAGIKSVSEIANSPCLLNFKNGAPTNRSSSAATSTQGLEPSTVRAVPLPFTVTAFSLSAFACSFWFFRISSLVRTFLGLVCMFQSLCAVMLGRGVAQRAVRAIRANSFKHVDELPARLAEGDM